MRWVGIDEAGYGPNLGPFVMTAIVAEGPGKRAPNLWRDLPKTVDRVGGDPDRLWVDDSKQVYRAGVGLDRLEAGAIAALVATGCELPQTYGGLLAGLCAGRINDVELSYWHDSDPPLVRQDSRELIERMLQLRPFEGSRWRLVAIRSVVFGPARFNDGLHSTGCKATVHFSAFVELMQWLWDSAVDGDETRIRSDKHGGRHFYYEPLINAFPDCWIDRGIEGPSRSRYTMRAGGRRLELDIRPKADADDGLVAIASMVSKAVREWWMSAFNAHWTARIDGLKPTAGYPGDSARFRAEIEPHCEARGLTPNQWWREK